VIGMQTNIKRGYCPKCLLELGITYTPQELAKLEDADAFPRRVGSSMWDANQVDDWLERLTGNKPIRPNCES
jgi:hypothetical protein